MNYLLVNTANDELVILVSKNGEIFACNESMVKRHNEVILPKMQELLNRANITLKDIDEFGVVIGPGSFTGIRVGIATLKAFKDVFNKPVKAINNLNLLHHIANASDVFNIVAIEGSMNSYFVAKFEQGMLNIYERNLTLDELKDIAHGDKVAMYNNTRNLEMGEVVKFNNQAFVEAFLDSKSYDLTPIYYQLSQAENDKIAHANIIVREAELYDVKAICELCEKYISTYPVDELNKNLIDKNHITYVAQIDEQVVGFALGFKSDNGVNLKLIAVDVNFRNHGIGTKLLNKVEDLVKTGESIMVEICKDCFVLETLCKKLGYIESVEDKNTLNKSNCKYKQIMIKTK